MPFLQNAGQKVNFLFALVAVLYLVLLTVDFARYGVVAPSWITAAFAIALGGWIGCRRSEKPAAPRVFAVLAVVSAAARVFRPRIRRIFHIGAVKTGHPTKTRMPGLFFIDFIGRNRLITSLYIFEWLLYVRSQHWKFCLVRSIRFFP